ncbi:MAG: hypothetical protein HYT50_01950 [Candidatus Wildermuthbacteria bacterium]|nr:hypothetical protein [Candidatus Wildermuthbacteria bacterium]
MTPSDLIQSSRTIRLVPGTLQQESLGNALALFSALSKLGKSVSMDSSLLSLPPSDWVQKDLFLSREAAIRIQGAASRISKISYEKDDQDLKLVLSLHSGTVEPRSVIVEATSQEPPDLSIIVSEEQGLHNPEITVNPHPTLRNFPRALDAVLQLLSPFQIPQTRLLLRVLSVLKYHVPQQACVFALEKRDFRNTQTNPKDVPHVLGELGSWAKPSLSLVALLESSLARKIHGILRTPKEDLKKKISQSFETQEKGSWILFSHPSHSIIQAKEHVTSLL